MNKKNIPFYFLVASVLLLTTGCVTVKNSANGTAANNTGGIYLSTDKGTAWKSKSLIPTVSGKPASFAGLDVASLVMDPSDNKAIYFGSVGNGMYFTYDGAQTWQVASGLGNNTIRAIAINPKSKCSIYIAVGNKVLRSQDCNRTWSQVYVDNPTVTVDSIAIDHYNDSTIYIGISRGDLVKSADAGASWKTVYRIKDSKIKSIKINPSDSRIIGLVTEKKGVFISYDSGDSWDDFTKILKEQKIGQQPKDIEFVKVEPQTVFVATTEGILRSKDNGKTWDKIELIPPEKNANINAMAVNQNNIQEIYYITNTTFYRSLDGGQTWKPFKLPSDRAGSMILLDPKNENLVYLAFKTIAKK
jgi:photosystem II stability/assembly factor-like uncharacterized protein